jgi:hypothetical protein
MDRAEREIAAVEIVVLEATEMRLGELADLRLVLVGGGNAEVIFE